MRRSGFVNENILVFVPETNISVFPYDVKFMALVFEIKFLNCALLPILFLFIYH